MGSKPFGETASRRDVIRAGLKAGAYAAPVVLAATVPAVGVAAQTPVPPTVTTAAMAPPTATTAPVVPPTATALPPAFTRPLTRELATIGSGTAGTTQTTTNCGGGFIQTFQVRLMGARPNTSFDVYLDQNSLGTAASHIFAGTFTTNGSGDAFFTSSITVPMAAMRIDNEITLIARGC